MARAQHAKSRRRVYIRVRAPQRVAACLVDGGSKPGAFGWLSGCCRDGETFREHLSSSQYRISERTCPDVSQNGYRRLGSN